MDIVVKGRNVEVPDHYRAHVVEKINKLQRYDHKLNRVDVELYHEPNPRQSDRAQRVEITCISRGPVVRAEACAPDFYSALDGALEKINKRLRRAADRRRIHYGRQTPVSVAAATAKLANLEAAFTPPTTVAEAPEPWAEAAEAEEYVPGRIVRVKEHPAEPMTVDDALFQMELVGHDFYLFLDKETGRPSVVYRRRKGYEYGVISLVPPSEAAARASEAA